MMRWEPDDGDAIDLSSPPYLAIRGRTGRGHPPVVRATEPVPFGEGTRTTAVRLDARTVDVPIDVCPPDGDLRTAIRALIRSLRGTGDGYLVDGGRRLRCGYVAGAEWVEEEPAGARLVASWHADDPAWIDVDPTSVIARRSAEGTFFPVPPLTLAGIAVLDRVEVDNTGDLDAWPVWEVIGPGVAPTLTNERTGAVLSLSGLTLAAGETLTIDTRPGVKAVTDGTGASRFADLDPAGRQLWPLVPGAQTVRLDMTGVENDSRLTLVYRRRWLTP